MSVCAKDDNAYQNHIYYRIAVSAGSFLIYITNLIQLGIALNEKLPQHPELQLFCDLSLRFVTIWNLIIQNVYACLALACDLSVLLKKPSIVPDAIRTYRNTLFYGLIFPMGWGICATFWLFYIYDRELIYPKKMDLVMSFVGNFICHGMISLYPLLELAFIPRDSQKNVYNPLKYLICFNCLYVLAVLYTRYVDFGIWPYDALTVTEGSISLYFTLASITVASTISYYIQKKIRDAIWSYRDNLVKKRQ